MYDISKLAYNLYLIDHCDENKNYKLQKKTMHSLTHFCCTHTLK